MTLTCGNLHNNPFALHVGSYRLHGLCKVCLWHVGACQMHHSLHTDLQCMDLVICSARLETKSLSQGRLPLLTIFCIFLAISRVKSCVEPPAPQVMSQKVGPYEAILSCRSNKFCTPCKPQARKGQLPSVKWLGRRSNVLPGIQVTDLICSWWEKLEGKERPALCDRRVHLVNNLHDEVVLGDLSCSRSAAQTLRACEKAIWPNTASQRRFTLLDDDLDCSGCRARIKVEQPGAQPPNATLSTEHRKNVAAADQLLRRPLRLQGAQRLLTPLHSFKGAVATQMAQKSSINNTRHA